ncbi:hypothetical protein HY484_04390 [Candidatus Woesearchaeota archaeon]|nr:hypothetical protein [Candidatus Woesearchaeota archaeon]
MKTPKELSALASQSRLKYVVSNLNVAMDRASLEGKVAKDGGTFEVCPMSADDWNIIIEYLEDYHWHAVLKYNPAAEKYTIKVSPAKED